MLKRTFHLGRTEETRNRASKSTSKSSSTRRSFRGDHGSSSSKANAMLSQSGAYPSQRGDGPVSGSTLTSSIITVVVGPEQRLFAAHEDVLSYSPCLGEMVKAAYYGGTMRSSVSGGDGIGGSRRITIPHESPEIFSCILEYLYKGDYTPRIVVDKRASSGYAFETPQLTPMTSPLIGHSPHTPTRSPRTPQSQTSSNAVAPAVDPVIQLPGYDGPILRDTAIYCSASVYKLPQLCKLALRKQGLQQGIEVSTILRSARYCYANTESSDSKLRAHYLALIIRGRKIFKRSGTMQKEMSRCCGGCTGHYGAANQGDGLWFDLFVAMCNHLDDVLEAQQKGNPQLATPKSGVSSRFPSLSPRAL